MSDDLSRNHEHKIKYRRRVQEALEREKELKEWLVEPITFDERLPKIYP